MSTGSPVPTLREQLVRETTQMLRYALARGLNVPPSVAQTVERLSAAPATDAVDVTALVQAHQKLAKLVAPATPAALVQLSGLDTAGHMGAMATVPLMRRMMIAAVVSLGLFIVSSLSPRVNAAVGGVLSESGIGLLTNEIFWIASAGLGASFAMLFRLNTFIVERRYDPRYEPAYWTKFMLGIIAGLILATLVPLPPPGPGETQLATPTLAMLGGFSASAVHTILMRLVSTIESLFEGDPKQETARREERATRTAEDRASQQRMQVAAALVDLQQRIAAGAPADEVASTLRDAVRSLTDPTAEIAPAAPPPADAPPASPAAEVASTASSVAAPAADASSDVAPAADASSDVAPAADAPAPPADDAPVPPPGTVAVPAIAPAQTTTPTAG